MQCKTRSEIDVKHSELLLEIAQTIMGEATVAQQSEDLASFSTNAINSGQQSMFSAAKSIDLSRQCSAAQPLAAYRTQIQLATAKLHNWYRSLHSRVKKPWFPLMVTQPIDWWQKCGEDFASRIFLSDFTFNNPRGIILCYELPRRHCPHHKHC